MNTADRESCRKEIIELHQFFQDWFHGVLPDTPEALARFSGVMAAEFRIVSPEGRMTARPALVEAIKKAYGVHRDIAFRIWIEDAQVRSLAPDLWLATYQEWQQTGAARKGRLSTALFRADPSAPNGLAWLHVHETWLPEASG